MTKVNVVVLAAGKGTRMYSSKPKVLHELGGKALLQHVVDTALSLDATSIHIVVGHGADKIRDNIHSPRTHFVTQEPQLGTGHAVQQALPGLEQDAVALVLYGDVPLIRRETLLALLQGVDQNSMGVLTARVPDPRGLGRILRNDNNEVVRIVEEKDADESQRSIDEINTGIMAIPVSRLTQWLPRLSANNAQKEYYLTDVVAMAVKDGCEIKTTHCDPVEASGINNRLQLSEIERYFQFNIARELMLAGVTLKDPARIDVRGNLTTGQDVEIDINNIFIGDVTLGNNVIIGPNCVITNSVIADGSVINANTVIEDSRVGRNCQIGPYARVRPGTELAEEVKLGNFVETKKARVARGSKINHLSYVGDTVMGENVNVGAGTITCNYDGVNKFLTEIGDDVFIGSNTALVAPVKVAARATIGAGSVITKEVMENQLAIARGRQSNIDGWKRPQKKQ